MQGTYRHTVLALKERQQLRRKIVSELRECAIEFATIDTAGVIAIKMAEDALPVL
jgi:hypothetical protein